MIRIAKTEDIERILEILKEVNLVHAKIRPDLFKIGTKYTYDELKTLIENKELIIFVYLENDIVAGYIINILKEIKNDNILNDIKTLYIDDLCVDSKFRGLGIAKKLYLYDLEYAKSIGCYNVTLNVWEGNDNAYEFYKHMGLLPQKTVMETIIK